MNKLDMISIIIYLIFGIASFILNLIDYTILNASWSKTPWKALAPCQLSCNIFIIFSGLFGILFIIINKEILFIIINKEIIKYIYLIIMILSSLFTWSIGIFSCIGGTIYNKKYHQLGCKSELTGVLEMYNNIDNYFIYADSLLCSEQCKCKFTESIRDLYLNNIYSPGSYSTFNSWDFTYKKITEKGTFNFWDNCSITVKEEVRNRYLESKNSLCYRINYEKFAKYWKNIEEKFNCTGWCQTNYIDPYTLKEKKMLKFIFSDINSGIPKYPGCINRLTNWLPSMVGATGGCLIVSAFVQSIVVILVLINDKKEERNSE